MWGLISVEGVSRPIDVLVEALRAEQGRGLEDVYLDEGARQILRDWHLQTKVARSGGAPQPQAPSVQVVEAAEPEAPRAPVVTEVTATGDTAAAKIESLKAMAQQWEPAKALGSLRETMVFSAGDPEAELMLIGEAPGYHEEREQEPFVGPAGQKLNDILKAMGLMREKTYISNIVKFRPAMPKQTTNNRKPTTEEMAACLPFIREEVRVVKPKIIVALGATAAEGLLELSGSVGRMRTSWYEFEGIPARVTYHPAYLLHGSAGLKDKRMIWEDMLEVMERLGLPVSDKQRGYFLPKS